MSTMLTGDYREAQVPGIVSGSREISGTTMMQLLGVLAPPLWQPGIESGEVYLAIHSSQSAAHTIVERAMLTFAELIRAVPEVIAVSHAREGPVVLVWTFIARRDKGVRGQVYRHEGRVAEEFPGTIFDFNVVSLDGARPGPFVADDLPGRLVFYREAALRTR